MNRNWRPCPICTGPLDDMPKWVTHGYLRNGRRVPWDENPSDKGWIRWECPRCGTVVRVKPFKNGKAAKRVSF